MKYLKNLSDYSKRVIEMLKKSLITIKELAQLYSRRLGEFFKYQITLFKIKIADLLKYIKLGLIKRWRSVKGVFIEDDIAFYKILKSYDSNKQSKLELSKKTSLSLEEYLFVYKHRLAMTIIAFFFGYFGSGLVFRSIYYKTFTFFILAFCEFIVIVCIFLLLVIVFIFSVFAIYNNINILDKIPSKIRTIIFSDIEEIKRLRKKNEKDSNKNTIKKKV